MNQCPVCHEPGEPEPTRVVVSYQYQPLIGYACPSCEALFFGTKGWQQPDRKEGDETCAETQCPASADKPSAPAVMQTSASEARQESDPPVTGGNIWTLDDGRKIALLTVKELHALPPETRIISISGDERTAVQKGMDAPDDDTRCGYTAWGLAPTASPGTVMGEKLRQAHQKDWTNPIPQVNPITPPAESATPTPRTDEQMFLRAPTVNPAYVPADFARTLEREAVALREDNKRLKWETDGLREDNALWHKQLGETRDFCDRLQKELEEAKRSTEIAWEQQQFGDKQLLAARAELAEANRKLAVITLDRDCWFNKDKTRHEQSETLKQQLSTALRERDEARAQVHDLCHDKHTQSPVTLEEFCDGCEAFQSKLFGKSPITDLRSCLALSEAALTTADSVLKWVDKQNAALKPSEDGTPAWHIIDGCLGEILRALTAAKSVRP